MKTIVALAAGLFAASAFAQAPPPDDTPSIKFGAVVFADYTYQHSPRITDIDGNRVNLSSFNVTRTYLNFTGNLNHRIAFRITPDIVRESGSGSTLSGSQTFRLKYAYAQLNLDDWTTKGSWVRAGMQQTPLIDYAEGIYRYRFQGPTFVDREGFLSSSDTGISAHYNFPGDRGDVHAGFYNGETFARPEANNEKAFMIRGTLRPLPAGMWKGLRLTAFVDSDHYVADAKRTRAVAQVSFEHPRGNAALELLGAKDRTSAAKPEVEARGFSIWATPKLTKGWELLFRHDELKPDDHHRSEKKSRNIAGIAYWVPNLNKVTAAVMADYDSLTQRDFTPSRPRDTRYGIKLLVSF